MSRQKKVLLQAITELDDEIRFTRAKQARHQHYFSNLIEKHRLLVLTMAIPAFVLGWQTGKQLRTKKPGKAIVKYSLLTVFKVIRNHLIR